jgi:TolB-like protein
LEWIIKKALRKDRDERYQTAREFLADLKNLAQRLDFEQELERSLDTTDAHNRVYQSQAKSSSPAIDSLAILAFQHNEPEPGMEYFSDGITESMINTLSRLPELRVMAWSTVSQYKGRQMDPRQVGRELRVRAVLTGRMMQSTERLAIKLELVDVGDGSQLWADNYTCNPADVLDVETQISSEISERLLLRITNEERRKLARRPTDNVEHITRISRDFTAGTNVPTRTLGRHLSISKRPSIRIPLMHWPMSDSQTRIWFSEVLALPH